MDTTTDEQQQQQQAEIVLNGIMENVSAALIRLHREAKEHKGRDVVEFAKRGMAITAVLNQLERDFGVSFMLYVFCKTNEKLGETLGPLRGEFLNKLTDNGFAFKNIEVVATSSKAKA
jgi:hypothetical protein